VNTPAGIVQKVQAAMAVKDAAKAPGSGSGSEASE